MGRTSSHIIETRSRDYIRGIIDNYYENGDALFREISERDYGIDGLIELFDNGNPTGQIALVQIKGTENTIQQLKSKDVVSCAISTSNAKYAKQSNIPIILFYVSLKKPQKFYYGDIHKAIKNLDSQRIEEQKSINVHIPLNNNSSKDLALLFEIIRNFYS